MEYQSLGFNMDQKNRIGINIFTGEDRKREEKEKRRYTKRLLEGIFKWVLPISIILLALALKNIKIGLVGAIWLGLSIFFSFFKKKKRSGWEKIDRLPDWAYKKMNRRKKNKVYGEHYLYMRKNGKYYKRKKNK